MDVKTRCDMACEILAATNDGDSLSPRDLKLVEMAVNGFLNEDGYKAFSELSEKVRAGYKPEWFHGIEHLTLNHEGYVLWKGQIVEHFNRPWAYGEEAAAYCKEIARRAKSIEVGGAAVSERTVVWGWEKYAEVHG